MAGLIAGLLGRLGAVDWIEARRWDAAERERETRIYVLVRPDALTPAARHRAGLRDARGPGTGGAGPWSPAPSTSRSDRRPPRYRRERAATFAAFRFATSAAFFFSTRWLAMQ